MSGPRPFPSPQRPRPGLLVSLDPESIEAVATRVAELLGGATPKLLDAGEVAERLGKSRDWCYRHAEELGAVRLGDGERPRVGFPADRVAAYVNACSASRRAGGPEERSTEPKAPGRRRRKRQGDGRSLTPRRLQVRGEEAR